MSGGEHQVLMAVVVALGCTRLDVVARIGEALGLAGAVDDLGSSDGVTITEDRVVIDPSVVPAPAVERTAIETAGRAAAGQLVDDDELEEVGRLAIVAGLPDVMQTAVRRALRTEPPRVPASVLRTWRDADLLDADDPHRGWVEAACAAAAAEPLPELLDRYEAVRAGFEAAGDVEAEIAVGMGAAVIARRADDFGTLIRLIGRGSQLVAAGHDEAIPPTVLGDALGHQLTGDHEAALAALDRFPADWLEGEWAAQVLMIRGTNLLLLDRTDDAIEAFEAATGHGTTWTYAVALELLGTARWNAGDRVGAIEDLRRSEELARAIGAVQNAALASAHLAVLEAADERPEATATARRARPPVGSAPNEEVDRLLAAAGVLRLAGAGDDAGAARAAAELEVPTRALRSAHWIVALRSSLVPGADGELAPLADAHPSLRHALVAGDLGRTHLASATPAPGRARRLLPARWCEPEPPTVELRLLGAPTVLHDGRD
ncbi:MAG: tetratricopeptide repeat protein, partial [Aquihabitans sp.]